VGRVLAEPDRRRAAERLLHLRELLAGGDAELGARLEDPEAGDLQRQVLAVGDLDQAVQGRVVERSPPGGVGGGLGREARVAGPAPAGGDGDLGPLEVGTDRARQQQRRREQRAQYSSLTNRLPFRLAWSS
jgi:hypothetical protein